MSSNRRVSVRDLSVRWDELAEHVSSADLYLCGAGYEPRSTSISERIYEAMAPSERTATVDRSLVLTPTEFSDRESHRDACRLYELMFPRRRLDCPAGSFRPVLGGVRETLGHRMDQDRVTVAIDYSSMPRIWYLPVLAMLARVFQRVDALLLYSVGDYSSVGGQYPRSRVGQVRAVPGFEGQWFQIPKIYVFGLGFDGVGTAALSAKLEVERSAVFWADPGADPKAPSRAEERNRELIKQAFLRFTCDLRSVEEATNALLRIAFEVQPHRKLILVPTGPKPHILACGLTGLSTSFVSVLSPHGGGGGIVDDPPKVKATGDVVATGCQISAASDRLPELRANE